MLHVSHTSPTKASEALCQELSDGTLFSLSCTCGSGRGVPQGQALKTFLPAIHLKRSLAQAPHLIVTLLKLSTSPRWRANNNKFSSYEGDKTKFPGLWIYDPSARLLTSQKLVSFELEFVFLPSPSEIPRCLKFRCSLQCLPAGKPEGGVCRHEA